MAELKFKPVRHDHARFIAKAKLRPGFAEVYKSLALEYELADQMLNARSRAGLTQDATTQVLLALDVGGCLRSQRRHELAPVRAQRAA